MKTIITLFATAIISLTSFTASAQTAFVNEVDMFTGEETVMSAFAVVDMNMKSASNGFTASFEAYNQNNIARYELQLSENNEDFSTVKRINTQASVNGEYKIDLNNTVILAGKVFYRIKIVSANGQVAYTASKKLTIK